MKIRDEIESWVCNEFGVTIEQVKSRSRCKTIKEARHLIIYLMKKFNSISLTGVGKLYNRTHATVIHSIKTIENWTTYEYEWKELEIRAIDHLKNMGLVEYRNASNRIKKPINGKVSKAPKIINTLVCHYFDVTDKQLKSRSRLKVHAEPRQLSMYLNRMYTRLSLKEIGKNHNRSHCSVVIATKRVNALMFSDVAWRSKVEGIVEKLNNFKLVAN